MPRVGKRLNITKNYKKFMAKPVDIRVCIASLKRDWIRFKRNLNKLSFYTFGDNHFARVTTREWYNEVFEMAKLLWVDGTKAFRGKFVRKQADLVLKCYRDGMFWATEKEIKEMIFCAYKDNFKRVQLIKKYGL